MNKIISAKIRIHLTTLISNNNEWWEQYIFGYYHHCQFFVVLGNSNFNMYNSYYLLPCYRTLKVKKVKHSLATQLSTTYCLFCVCVCFEYIVVSLNFGQKPIKSFGFFKLMTLFKPPNTTAFSSLKGKSGINSSKFPA